MRFYAASALLLINAQMTLAGWSFDPTRLCEDALPEKFCLMIKKRGQCHLGSYVEYTERNCWKTCGNCIPDPKKPKETCKNQADAKTCYDLYEKGLCDVVKTICPKTCYFCY
ncbi:hypothetical protein V3C99_016025 [Haemonchus contortus]